MEARLDIRGRGFAPLVIEKPEPEFDPSDVFQGGWIEFPFPEGPQRVIYRGIQPTVITPSETILNPFGGVRGLRLFERPCGPAHLELILQSVIIPRRVYEWNVVSGVADPKHIRGEGFASHTPPRHWALSGRTIGFSTLESVVEFSNGDVAVGEAQIILHYYDIQLREQLLSAQIEFPQTVPEYGRRLTLRSSQVAVGGSSEAG